MRKIKNGKRYDTDAALEVAYFWNGLSPDDPRHLNERLYKTAKGAWFLHGSGGANTRWSEICGYSTSRGEDIVPMTSTEALEWCEESSIYVGIIEANFEITEA